MKTEWSPTEDTLYSHSTNGCYAVGEVFPWMGVEEVDGVWHSFLYTISPPRNEFGDFSYDLFPDNNNHTYTLAGGKVCDSRQDALAWCQRRDQQLKEITQ